MRFSIKTAAFFVPCFLSLFLCGCAVSESARATADFGADADYFVGLQKLAEGKENDARTKFLHCIKKGSYYCAKRSAQALTTFGSVQQKNVAALELIQLYPDSESLLIAANQLYSSNEIHKVISITQGLDVKKEKDALLKIRFDAMEKRGDSSFMDEVYSWFTLCPLSSHHIQFFYDHQSSFDNDEDYRNQIIKYRVWVYERNYTLAKQSIPFVLENLNPELPLLVSDTGKVLLYTTAQFSKDADLFETYAKNHKQTPLEFYFWFYSARFYEKAGMYKKANANYQSAINAALEPSQKDNALWYLMENQLSISLENSVASLKDYAPQFNDPEYFDDYFDKLLSSLLHNSSRNLIYSAYNQIKGYATKETCAKYAYVYARLVQEGITVPKAAEASAAEKPESLVNDLFVQALDSGSDVYYKLMSAYRLGYENAQVVPYLYKQKAEQKQTNREAEILLEGYAHFGFPEKIYAELFNFTKEEISTDTMFMIARFLSKCSVQNPDYYVQALRVASRAASSTDRKLDFEEVKLLYPKNYSEMVDTFSQKYGITDSTVYSLVRSESFFDSQVVSHAGAIGLSQLMPLTAQDVARKLKRSDYSLYDAETNLEFGVYYLSDLYRRCDNSMLLAFFSYNAGITRVRRWLQTSLAEFGRKGDLSSDLFLETLPYEETREYGRKLVSACAMYELLYSEDSADSYKQIIESLIY